MIESEMRYIFAKIFIVTAVALANLVSAGCYDHRFETYPFEVKCLNNDTYLRITCHTDDWIKSLVKLDLPFASSVGFIDCNFPRTANLPEILRIMNVTVNDHITIAGRYSSLTRDNYRNLSVAHLQLSGGYDNMSLSYDLLYDVTDLNEFDIIGSDVVQIPEAFFEDWAKNIVTLQLFKNKLRKIARADFARLVNVEILDLRQNDLDEIEPSAFDNLTHLHTLRLDNNRLHTLPSGLFHQLGRLTDVSLSLNFFDELPQNLLETTASLTIFAMIKNDGKLKAVPNGFFKNLGNLETVYMEGSQVESLPADLFIGCFKLSRVSIEGNKLRNLPAELFADTRSLEYLEIRNNRLESLPSQWSENDMEGLQSLKHFDVSGNNLTRIDSRLIRYLKSAIVVNLSRNQLNFDSSDKVEYQSVSPSINDVNGTRTFDIEIFQQSNLDSSVKLKRIDLSHNRIVHIDADVMSILRYSETIDLSYNRISKINMSALSFALSARDVNETGKMTMSLRENPLRCDCELTDFVRYLAGQDEGEAGKIIIDDHEYYGGISCASPAELKGLPVFKLRPAELSCVVETSAADDACNGTCRCLEYTAKRVLAVDCSRRNLTRLPLMIHNEHDSSIELNMTGNNLQLATYSDRPYSSNVTSLDLSNCNVNDVTLDMFSPRLRSLRLHGNHISRLNSDVIEYLARNDSLRDITFHDNQWICDCETRRFFDFVKETFAKYDFHEIGCDGAKRKLYQMTVSEFCSVTGTEVITSVFIVLLILAIFAALYYKYRRRCRTWSYVNPPL
ncbi:protein toll-like [Phymastichus coffea]|uniref:protein toll-like n=1 Tax=Phymastichus coffea TaxID=108790 RepID=UPI00273A8534|nr:protein toll-like [Phymastichus coffea]XP_058806259.1 protein toll-like [Phymastichus coffea]